MTTFVNISTTAIAATLLKKSGAKPVHDMATPSADDDRGEIC